MSTGPGHAVLSTVQSTGQGHAVQSTGQGHAVQSTGQGQAVQSTGQGQAVQSTGQGHAVQSTGQGQYGKGEYVQGNMGKKKERKEKKNSLKIKRHCFALAYFPLPYF